MPRIRKTLLVGLGGTGVLALKYAKYKYEKNYGVVPPMVKLLALDTNLNDLKSVLKIHGSEVKLDQNEYYHIKIDDPRAFVEEQDFINEWFPRKNLNHIDKLTEGAGQIRSMGRLGLLANFHEVKEKLKLAWMQINEHETLKDEEFTLAGPDMSVALSFSIAGGTGSGTFLDIAYLIQQELDMGGNDSMVGYLLLPDYFKDKLKNIQKKRIEPNAYGALRELEYFMDDPGNKEIQSLDLGAGNEIDIKNKAPFKEVFLINNTTNDNVHYDEVEHLMELVGNQMVIASSLVSDGNVGAWDNIKKDIAAMDRIGSDKKYPRYIGLGYAELYYDAERMGEFASLKCQAHLLDKITEVNSSLIDNIESLATNWKIKEHDADLLIDTISEKIKKYSFSFDGEYTSGASKAIEMQKTNWLNGETSNFLTAAEERRKSHETAAIESIKTHLIENVMTQDYGLGSAINFIDKLLGESYVGIYLSEMKDELIKQLPGKKEGVNQLIKRVEDLLKENGSFYNEIADAEKDFILFRKGNIQNACSSYENKVNEQLSLEREKIRREQAIIFYNNLKVELGKFKTQLTNLKNNLINEQGTQIKNEIDKYVRTFKETGIKPFLSNLHEIALKEYSTPTDQITIPGYLSTNNFKSLAALLNNNISNTWSNYTNTLAHVKHIQEGDILKFCENTLGIDEYKKQISILEKSAQPLWNLRKEKFASLLKGDWTTTILWGFTDKNHDYCHKATEYSGKNAETTSTLDKRIISLSTAQYPAPVTGIRRLKYYYDEYYKKNAKFSFDIDKRITSAMDKAGYDLINPYKIEQSHIAAWVWGCIFFEISSGAIGITRKGGKYKVYSRKKGRGTEGYFVELDTWRDKAFEQFVEDKHAKELLGFIKTEYNKIGDDKFAEILNTAKDSNTYYETYSQLGKLGIKTIKDSNNEKYKDTQNLLDKELNYLNTFEIEQMGRLF